MTPNHKTSTTPALMKCLVKVKTMDGKTVLYHGLFKSTTDATIDALERMNFRRCMVSVRRV